MFALVDCNNFYASCERLFRPDLRKQPIVVLSNNDGCVIARSNEAKKLDIAMGVPYFQIRQLCKVHRVRVFSSNFALYGNLSDRVMSTIEHTWPHTEIYSIDEAFLALHTLPSSEHLSFSQNLNQRILRDVGMPTSIGLGKTKTLAKLANHVCKKMLGIPVFNIMDHMEFLSLIPVHEVWGVGRQLTAQLLKQNIRTAFDLSRAKLRGFTLPLQRTILELNGVEALSIEDTPLPPKSIMSSRSFSPGQTHLPILNQALSEYCKIAYDKLRTHQLLTQHIQVFLRTSPHSNEAYYANSAHCTLNPTDDLITLTRRAKDILATLYRPGLVYNKLGVCLSNLCSKHSLQFTLLPATEPSAQEQRWLDVVDAVNHKYGSHTLKLAASGLHTPWKTPQILCSPAYTTRWAALPIVKA